MITKSGSGLNDRFTYAYTITAASSTTSSVLLAMPWLSPVGQIVTSPAVTVRITPLSLYSAVQKSAFFIEFCRACDEIGDLNGSVSVAHMLTILDLAFLFFSDHVLPPYHSLSFNNRQSCCMSLSVEVIILYPSASRHEVIIHAADCNHDWSWISCFGSTVPESSPSLLLFHIFDTID